MIRLTKSRSNSIKKSAYGIRKIILDISRHAGVGHIAPALSVTDIIAVLYHAVLRVTPAVKNGGKRDHFILSKGHAAAALYGALYQKKLISEKQLFSFCTDGGILGVHPDYNRKLGIEMTSGSLGHGLAVAAGMAWELKRIYPLRTPRVFVLVSDAELNEGSVWETVIFAAHHKIGNLTVIVDDNGNQAFGKTRDVLKLEPLSEKFSAFGWYTKTVGGHNIPALFSVLQQKRNSFQKPTVIIAKTVAGYGVGFMEGKIEWHYLPLTDGQYKKALNDIKKTL